jgi:hypothetical protein
MILYKAKNRLFNDRLEAKRALGHNRYNKMLKTGDLIFTTNSSAIYEVHNNSEKTYDHIHQR